MSISKPEAEQFSRRIRSVPAPLGAYLRPGRNDHTALLQLLSERRPAALSGFVFDPLLVNRQAELYAEAGKLNLEVVFDTRAVAAGKVRSTCSRTRSGIF